MAEAIQPCCCCADEETNIHEGACCPGWGHFNDGERGAEIERCDGCYSAKAKNGVANDAEAIHKHRIDCGCDFPEMFCRGIGGWTGEPLCDKQMRELEPFLWVCDCGDKEDFRCKKNQPKSQPLPPKRSPLSLDSHT